MSQREIRAHGNAETWCHGQAHGKAGMPAEFLSVRPVYIACGTQASAPALAAIPPIQPGMPGDRILTYAWQGALLIRASLKKKY